MCSYVYMDDGIGRSNCVIFRASSTCSARIQLMLYSIMLILRGRGDNLGFKSCMGISVRPPSQKGVTSAESVWQLWTPGDHYL